MKKVYRYPDGGTIIYISSRRKDSTVMTGFFAGSLDNEKNGVAHLLEHSLFLQTEKRGKETLQKDIQSIVPSLNASTGTNRLYIDFYRTTKLLEPALELVSDMLFNTKFDENLIQKEKGVIAEEYNEGCDRRKRDVFHFHKQIVFKDGELCSLEKSVGSPEDLAQIDISDLQAFKDKNFTRQDFFFAICTAMSFRKVRKLVEKYFLAKLPASTGERKNLNADRDFDSTPQMQVVTNEQNMISMVVSFMGKGGYLDDRYDPIGDMISDYFNGNNGALFTALRDQGLVYSAGIGGGRTPHMQIYDVVLRTSKDKIVPALTSLAKVFGKIRREGFEMEIVENIRQNILYGMDENTPDFHLSRLRRFYNRYCRYETLDIEKPREMKKRYQNVTLDQLNSQFRDIFNADNKPYITILGNVKSEELPSYDAMIVTLHNELKK